MTESAEKNFPAYSHLPKFAVPAMRSVQAVIKERAAKAEQAKAVVEPEVTQVQEVAKQEPDWDYLEIPTYLRKGKELVW